MIIRGNTVGTTMPKPDWKQNDPEKGGFIFNKDKAPQAYYIHATYKDDDFVLDKTMAEIVEAVENGFTPFICYVDGDTERYLPLKFITEDKTSAVFASFENGKEYQIFVESDAEETWVIGQGVIEKEYALKSDIPEIPEYPEYPEYPDFPESGGGGAKAFYFTIAQDENGAWTPSKTYEEVKAAYEAGSAIIAGVDVGSWLAYVPLGEMGASGTHAFVGHFIDQEGYSNSIVLMASHCAVGKGSNPIGGGAGGVCIDPDSIESHSTNEDGGENTLEFDLTDGTHVKLSAFNGRNGADGKTPEKNVDYFTEEDKAAFVQDVLAALPTWEGGSY